MCASCVCMCVCVCACVCVGVLIRVCRAEPLGFAVIWLVHSTLTAK